MPNDVTRESRLDVRGQCDSRHAGVETSATLLPSRQVRRTRGERKSHPEPTRKCCEQKDQPANRATDARAMLNRHRGLGHDTFVIIRSCREAAKATSWSGAKYKTEKC